MNTRRECDDAEAASTPAGDRRADARGAAMPPALRLAEQQVRGDSKASEQSDLRDRQVPDRHVVLQRAGAELLRDRDAGSIRLAGVEVLLAVDAEDRIDDVGARVGDDQ